MSGVVQVAGDGTVGDGGTDGLHAVGGGNAGGDAFGGLNGNGEGRAVPAGVVCHHLRQFELANLVFRQAEADDAAFIFAILIVHDKDARPLRTAATAASTRSLGVVVN